MRSEGEAERPGGERGKRGGRIDSRGAPASARQATRSAHSARSSPRNRHHTLRLGCALCNNLAVVGLHSSQHGEYIILYKLTLCTNIT